MAKAKTSTSSKTKGKTKSVDYASLKAPELKDLLGQRHLSKHGKKDDLVERLMDYDARQSKIEPGLMQLEELCQMKGKDLKDIAKRKSDQCIKYVESGRKLAPKTANKPHIVVQFAGLLEEKSPTLDEVNAKVEEIKKNNPNKELAEYFHELEEEEEENFKKIALASATFIFTFWPHKISSSDDAEGICGVSEGTKNHIDNFFSESHKRKADSDDESSPNKKSKATDSDDEE